MNCLFKSACWLSLSLELSLGCPAFAAGKTAPIENRWDVENRRTSHVDVPDLFIQGGVADGSIGRVVLFSPNAMLGDSTVMSLPYIRSIQQRFPNLPVDVYTPWAHLMNPNQKNVTYHKIPSHLKSIEQVVEHYFARGGEIDEKLKAEKNGQLRTLFVTNYYNAPWASPEDRGHGYIHSPMLASFFSRNRVINLIPEAFQLIDYKTGRSKSPRKTDMEPVTIIGPITSSQRRGFYNIQNNATVMFHGIKNVPPGTDKQSILISQPALQEEDFKSTPAPIGTDPLPEPFVFFNLNTSAFRTDLHQNYEPYFRALLEELCFSVRAAGHGDSIVVARPVILNSLELVSFMAPSSDGGPCPFDRFIAQLGTTYGIPLRVISDQPKNDADHFLLQQAMKKAKVFLTHDTGLLHVAAVYRGEVDRRRGEVGRVPRTISFVIGSQGTGWPPPGGYEIRHLNPMEKDSAYRALFALVQHGLHGSRPNLSNEDVVFIKEADLKKMDPPVLRSVDDGINCKPPFDSLKPLKE